MTPTTITVRVAGEEVVLAREPPSNWWYGEVEGLLLKMRQWGDGFRVYIWCHSEGNEVEAYSAPKRSPQLAIDAAIAEVVAFAGVLTGGTL